MTGGESKFSQDRIEKKKVSYQFPVLPILKWVPGKKSWESEDDQCDINCIWPVRYGKGLSFMCPIGQIIICIQSCFQADGPMS